MYLDIDECSTGVNLCDINSICLNEIGSYDCQCNHGYRGSGFSCEG